MRTLRRLISISMSLASLGVLGGGCSEDSVVPSISKRDQESPKPPVKPGGGDEKDPTDITNPSDEQMKPGGSANCMDECTVGEKSCGSEGARVCGFFDADECTDWSDLTPCPEGCAEDGECRVSEVQPCSNMCASGTTACAGNGVKTCADLNGDGCAEWSDVKPCGTNEVCVEGKCDKPAPACKDACTKGTKECSGSGYRSCGDSNGDGCTEWSAVTACGTGEVCKEGKCEKTAPTCTNACTKGAKECSGNGYRTCGDANGDGCTEWSGVTKCDYGCEKGACKPNPNAWVPACTTAVCPNVISSFPATISGNNAGSKNLISQYTSCASTDEAGPEDYYIFKVNEPGTVVAGITEPSGGDVDIHLLKSLSADGCISRSDKGIGTHVAAGIYYLSVDAFQSASNAGAYNLYVTFLPDSGKCGLAQTTINRYNTPSTVNLPQTGKIVKEAHMVTVHDQQVHGAGWWPSSSSEGLAEHKAYTASITGFTGSATEKWCPSGEGGCQYGQGATGKAVPDAAEAWYICMYWKNKPTPGTRFLVMNPANGKAVVAAAGYETGPGDGTRLGGAVDEVHGYCGTSHLGTLMFAQLKDQSLAYGPIDCSK